MYTIRFYAFVSLVLLGSLWGGSAAFAQVMTIEVKEDSWINGLNSTTNKGMDTRLGVCPLAQYWIYLKFDLSSIVSEIQSVSLHMKRFDGARPEELNIYRLPDDSWTEATLVGQTRPQPTTVPVNEALAPGAETMGFDKWASEPFTEAVKAEWAGDKILTLMVREDPKEMVDVRFYYSREGAPTLEERPHLQVTLQPAPAEEQISEQWEIGEVGFGVKPSFDYDAQGRLHVMGMTEEIDGGLWYAVSNDFDGPWKQTPVAQGYFYGPGDIRVDRNGNAHIAWHDHDKQNPAHAVVAPSGGVSLFEINTPSSHDGWDNSLFIAEDGKVHQASVFPLTFGAMDCLQYGVFSNGIWTYERNIAGSGNFMYGFNTTLAVDSRGAVHILYCQSRDWTTPGDLMYAVKRNGAWTASKVTNGGIRGRFPSMELDHWDRPNAVWLDIDEANNNRASVKYGVLNAEQWEIEEIDVLENVELGHFEARKSVSIDLDQDWRPHVSYSDKRVVKYADKPFDQWQITPVAQSSEDLYKGLAVLRLDAQQRPGIVFWQRHPEQPGLIRLARVKGTGVEAWRNY